MDWHNRYVQQAAWTGQLREYLFQRARLSEIGSILEVGCGTGAVLSTLQTTANVHGLDLDAGALAECRLHAPAAHLTRGDANSLPYRNECFDITYCHFLLLWVKEPVKAVAEMKRVTKTKGHVFAFAEPDYTAREDRPRQLAALGNWQTEGLTRQGADVSLGNRLAEVFYRAGIRIMETGAIQSRGSQALKPEEWENEWAIIESDLAGVVGSAQIQHMKLLDEQARAHNTRVLNVPTYFVWGQV